MKIKLTKYLATFAIVGSLPVIGYSQDTRPAPSPNPDRTLHTTEVQTGVNAEKAEIELRENARWSRNQNKSIQRTQLGSATNSSTGTATHIDTDRVGQTEIRQERQVTPGVSAGGSAGGATNTGSGAGPATGDMSDN